MSYIIFAFRGWWMFIKKIVLAVFMSLLVLVLSVLAMGRSLDLYDWFVWWVADREPISYKGMVSSAYEYKGRESGVQRLFFSISDGQEVVLHSALNKKTLNSILDKKEELVVRLYPTPAGRKYIYYIRSNGMVVYKEGFRDSGWPGFLMFLVCLFYYFVVFFLVRFLLKSLRR